MARNIAKRFATMTLLYWAPRYEATKLEHETPVEFKGFYIGSANMMGDDIGRVINSKDGKNDNMVLFYLTKPEEGGFVSWDQTLAGLSSEGLTNMSPAEIPGTHKIKTITILTMPRTKTPSLENQAFIAAIE
jgi:hypothetical protein